MARAFVGVVFSLISIAVVGCGGVVTRSVSPPAELGQQSRFQKTRHEPVLVAPPPAYGNKIVMAASDRDQAAN